MFETTTRDRRGERREATRAEILDAAWELCRVEGLAGLSLRDLGRAVGLKAPSLYAYFASKHAIYDAMFLQGTQAFARGQAELPWTGDGLADLKLSMRFFVEFCAEDLARYQLLFQRTIPGFEPSEEAFAPSVASLAALADRLEAAGLGGPGRLDLLTAIGTGLAAQQLSNDPGGDRWLRLLDEAMEMFFDHVTRAPVRPPARRRR